ncbi:MAG: D-cysteine desulfhydrase family protein [Desulfatirhabdiaceae bacterium]
MKPSPLTGLLAHRIHLAHLPTPIQFMPRMSDFLGIRLYVKRDDLTESIASGNKIRKLEYLMADAQKSGADTVISYGGVQSNHCRAVAWAAAKLGLSCVLALRGEAPDQLEGNLLLDHILGADVRFYPKEMFQNPDHLDSIIVNELREKGKIPYSIPVGGSNATGTLGYVQMMGELMDSDIRFDHLYHSLGSGGTFAGMWLGRKLYGLESQVHGIAVCDDVDYFVGELARIRSGFQKKYDLVVDFSDADKMMDDRYVGIGYALNTDTELKELVRYARLEGLILDPVYTLKAFLGMADHIRTGIISKEQTVLFIHTGGHAGLFPKHAEIEKQMI